LKHELQVPLKPKGSGGDLHLPNLGADQDIVDAQNNIAAAEDTLGTWTPTQDKNGFWNVPTPFAADSYNYHGRDVFVQLDAETESDPICSSAGCDQYEHPKLKGYPMDYPVPSFGADPEITSVHSALANAETQVGHKWVLEPLGKDKGPVIYNDQKPLDVDIQNSLESMDRQEGIHGAWNPAQDKDGNWIVPKAIDNRSYSYDSENVQLADDPICNSAGCTQYLHPEAPKGHPVDYPVPSFGADPDIETTANSISIGEAQYNHKIIMGTEESKAQWHNPAKDVDYNFAPALDHDIVTSQKNLANTEQILGSTMDVQTSSDPICSSAGCTQYEWPAPPKGHPVDYPVPNFGAQDSDIAANFNSLAAAEKIQNHHWNFHFYDTPINPAKKTLYDWTTPLDSDVVHSAHSLEQAEEQLGQRMIIWDEPPKVITE
jgi:hypothetical protein